MGKVGGVQKKAYRFLRRFSIRGRLRAVFLVELALALCWSGLMVLSSVRTTVSYVGLNNAGIIAAASAQLDGALASLDTVTRYPVTRAGGEPGLTYTYLSDPDAVPRRAYETDLKKSARTLFEVHPDLGAVAVFQRDGGGVLFRAGVRYRFHTELSGYAELPRNQSTAPWFTAALATKGKEFLLPLGEIDDPQLLEQLGDGPGLLAVRSIFNIEKFENVGVILAYADLGPGLDRFESQHHLPGEEIGLFTPEGKQIYGGLSPADFARLEGAASWEGGVGSLFLGGKLYTYTADAHGYRWAVATPLGPILTESLSRQSGFLLLLVVVVGLIAACTSALVGSITRPIRSLVRACEEMRQKQQTIPIEDDAGDELAEFARAFNRLEHQIEDLVAAGYKKDLALTQTELHMLRQQINPHFLYNTLESIRATAQQRGEAGLEEMTLLLSKVLRYGVSLPDHIVTVGRELDCLADYIALQGIHYREAVSFFVHVDEALRALPIIKLVLQPLVENALYHGVKSLAQGGTVTVLGFVEEERLLFQVIDNGLGISPEKLNLLNAYIQGGNDAFQSVGVKNVNRRIRLYYGPGYGVEITSRPGQGTMATVTLPLKPPAAQERTATSGWQ